MLLVKIAIKRKHIFAIIFLSHCFFFSVFKVLFKIKELTNKAVYNDSLSLLQKCFCNFNSLDVNKFLVQFWNCDVFKDRELGPIGYSFTEGRARYDFSGTAPNNNDIVTINAKAVDVGCLLY